METHQSGIDANRISLIGWSYGGGSILAALSATNPNTPIGKAVMYHPVCRGARTRPGAIIGLMLLGAADDIAPPALCNAVAQGAQKLKLIGYPNARHGFDLRRLPENEAAGTPAYDPEAAAASWTAVMEFLK